MVNLSNINKSKKAFHDTENSLLFLGIFQDKKCYCCDDQHNCGNIVGANWVYFIHNI